MENLFFYWNEGYFEIFECYFKYKIKNIFIDIFSVILVDDIKCY